MLSIIEKGKKYNIIICAGHAHLRLVISVLNVVTELQNNKKKETATISGLWRNNSIALILNSIQLVYFIVDFTKRSENAYLLRKHSFQLLKICSIFGIPNLDETVTLGELR